MCFRVARRCELFPDSFAARNFKSMMHLVSQNLARRARLSTRAIFAAVFLTVAALIALMAAIGQRDVGGYQIESPVTPLDEHKKAAS